MTNAPNVHVFVSADGQRIALSTLPDGGNLPSITDSERWLALALVPMTMDYMRKYVTDARAALANLAATGFHVVQIGAGSSVSPTASSNSLADHSSRSSSINSLNLASIFASGGGPTK
jgi:hypothetical protein